MDRLPCPAIPRAIDGETPWMPPKNRIGPVPKAKMPVQIHSYS